MSAHGAAGWTTGGALGAVALVGAFALVGWLAVRAPDSSPRVAGPGAPAAPAGAELRRVSLPAGAVTVAERGRGQSVLVLHGTPGGWDQGLWLGRELVAGGFRVLAPSRPGYPGTPAGPEPSLDEGADRIARALAERSSGPVAVMAWSGGAPTAVALASRHPDRISALVLLAPALGPGGSELGSKPPSDPGVAVARVLLRRVPSLVAGLPLERVGVPTLLVHGTEDARIPLARSRQAAARISGARLLEVDGAGHLLPLHPGYGRVLDRILPFLRGAGRGSGPPGHPRASSPNPPDGAS